MNIKVLRTAVSKAFLTAVTKADVKLKMNIEILKLTPEFTEDFGYVIYTAWGEAYKGLMPDSVLEGRSSERWTQRAKENPENKYIAFADGKAVGVIGFLPQARDFVTNRESGEIVALYVLKEYQKNGIGKALLNEALNDIGEKNVTLFMLKGNDNAASFYRKMGFCFTGKELSDNGLIELEMILKR